MELPIYSVTPGAIVLPAVFTVNIGILFSKEVNRYSSVTGHHATTLTNQNGGKKPDRTRKLIVGGSLSRHARVTPSLSLLEVIERKD